MTLGEDESDELAYELAQTDFDAVERAGYRAAWTEDNTAVVVTDLESGDERVYDGEDLVRAASDTDVRNARNPENGVQ
jgi:hypothetical protein